MLSLNFVIFPHSADRLGYLCEAVMGRPEGLARPPLVSAMALCLLALLLLCCSVSSLPPPLPRVFLSFEGKKKKRAHKSTAPRLVFSLAKYAAATTKANDKSQPRGDILRDGAFASNLLSVKAIFRIISSRPSFYFQEILLQSCGPAECRPKVRPLREVALPVRKPSICSLLNFNYKKLCTAPGQWALWFPLLLSLFKSS